MKLFMQIMKLFANRIIIICNNYLQMMNANYLCSFECCVFCPQGVKDKRKEEKPPSKYLSSLLLPVLTKVSH